jgi:parallel beta-helix repeat protein
VVTDGVYFGGVTVSNPVTLLSINGANSTVINAGGRGPSISLTNGASLIGFTVTGGRNFYPGAGGVICSSASVVLIDCVISNNIGIAGAAGVYGGTLNNCTIADNNGGENGIGGAVGSTLNSCTVTGNYGDTAGGASECTLNYCMFTGNESDNGAGAAYYCTLNSCIIADNSCGGGGGGAYACTLNDCLVCYNGAAVGGGACFSALTNCTLTGNTASGDYEGISFSGGGGVYDSALNNCISYFNNGPPGGAMNYDTNSTLNYCCTIPLPASGIGNITNNPLFVNPAGGNFQLQSN